MGLRRALFPAFRGKQCSRPKVCTFSHGGGGSSNSLLATGLAIKEGWGTVRVAGVSAARLIRPVHPILYLHMWEVLQTTETIKVRQESFIMDRGKKKSLCGSRGEVVQPPQPPPRSASAQVSRLLVTWAIAVHRPINNLPHHVEGSGPYTTVQ